MIAKDVYPQLLGMVLCGGRSTRMNGEDKGLTLFHQKPMASYPIKALSCCAEVIINANRNQDKYKKHFRMTVLNDSSDTNTANFQGPLAGMLAGLRYAKKNGYSWLITAPCDAPFITADYVHTMWQASQRSHEKIFMASDGFRQPVFSLLHTDIYSPLGHFLSQSENKKILVFYQQIGYKIVHFENSQLFTNINSHQEKAQHEK